MKTSGPFWFSAGALAAGVTIAAAQAMLAAMPTDGRQRECEAMIRDAMVDVVLYSQDEIDGERLQLCSPLGVRGADARTAWLKECREYATRTGLAPPVDVRAVIAMGGTQK